MLSGRILGKLEGVRRRCTKRIGLWEHRWRITNADERLSGAHKETTERAHP